jgi:phage replication initiation protein
MGQGWPVSESKGLKSNFDPKTGKCAPDSLTGGCKTHFEEVTLKNPLKTPFCDWLSFTIKFNQASFAWINSYFGEHTKEDHGMNGYSNFGYFAGGGSIAYSPNRELNGIHIDLSAKALSSQGKDVCEIISYAIEHGGKFSRIDIALDDYDGFLDLDMIYDKIESGEVRTRLDSYRRMVSGSLKRKIFGDTIYIGSPASETMVRIYNKGAQTETDDHWIRLEFQLRGSVANEYCNPDPKLHDGEIKTYKDRDFCKTAFYYLRFIDRKYNGKNKPIHKQYWNASEFWVDFLRTGEGEKIGIPNYKLGLEDVREWIGTQVSGALALMQDTYGDEEIKRITEAGKKKMEKNSRYKKLSKEFHDGRNKKQNT